MRCAARPIRGRNPLAPGHAVLTLSALVDGPKEPALADTNLATTINYTNGPVQIETCKAWLSDTSVGNRNYYISQAVSFENGASQPIVAVRFAFQVLDPFGQPVRTMTGDATGTFAPQVLIQPGFRQGGAVGNSWTAINISPSIDSVVCDVQLVRFADGTLWHQGTPYLRSAP